MRPSNPRNAKCRICGCSPGHPCPGGCRFAEEDLCTICASVQDLLRDYLEYSRRVTAASIVRLYREAAEDLKKHPTPYARKAGAR